MADKKKKPSARNLYKSSRDKLVKEFVENSHPDDTKSEQSTLRQGLKGNASKAIKKAIKSNKPEGSKLKKTPLQAGLTATPNKAIKELVKQPFIKQQEAQKQTNKEYRKERNKLRRRVEYFKSRGYQFSEDIVPPHLEGNATTDEIEYLKELRGDELKRRATSFTPPVVQQADVPASDNYEEIFEVPDENIGVDLETEDVIIDGKSLNDILREDDYEDYTPEQPQTPQERYYSENKDREYDDNSSVERGRLILQNIYDDFNVGQPEKLGAFIHEDSELYNYKRGAAQDFINMIEDCIERIGEDATCMLIEENAGQVKYDNEIIMYYIDSDGYDATVEVTEESLVRMQTIFEGDSPDLLMTRMWGNPENI